MANIRTFSAPETATDERVAVRPSGGAVRVNEVAHVAKKLAVSTYNTVSLGQQVTQYPKTINTLKSGAEAFNASSPRTNAPSDIPSESLEEGGLASVAREEGDLTSVAREASGLSQAAKIGVAFTPAIFGAITGGVGAIVHGGSTKQVLVGMGYGAANGALAVDDWKTAFGEQKGTTAVDRWLAGGRAVTAVIATGAGIASFTPVAPVAMPIAAAAGLANIGLGLVQDIAHWTGLANNQGTLGSSYDALRDLNALYHKATAHADANTHSPQGAFPAPPVTHEPPQSTSTTRPDRASLKKVDAPQVQQVALKQKATSSQRSPRFAAPSQAMI